MTALKIAARADEQATAMRAGCDQYARHASLVHGWFLNDEWSPSPRLRDELLAAMTQQTDALAALLDQARADVSELAARRDER